MGLRSRVVVIFGSSGQIGSALACGLSGRSVITIPWSGEAGFLRSVLAAMPTEFADVVFAGGITDPSQAEDSIQYSNTLFPQQIIWETRSRRGFRYLTIGTVMENFPAACEVNAYLRSKRTLGTWVSGLAKTPEMSGRLCHVRLHTIYGGVAKRFLKPHMFLGQIASALMTGSEFRMTSGEQFREYHHADDIALSLIALLHHNWIHEPEPIVQINNGLPVRLRDLARDIFRAFGRETLLKVGVIDRPVGENVDQVFPRSNSWLLPRVREPIAGVTHWLRYLLPGCGDPAEERVAY